MPSTTWNNRTTCHLRVKSESETQAQGREDDTTTMKLSEFVSQTLVQTIEGVTDAQDAIGKTTGVALGGEVASGT